MREISFNWEISSFGDSCVIVKFDSWSDFSNVISSPVVPLVLKFNLLFSLLSVVEFVAGRGSLV